MKKTIVVNLFGGPGTGKSSTAAKVFTMLKDNQIDCELITEFAKDLVWEGRLTTFDDDIYLFAKQNHRQFRVNGKVDVLITDSPLPLKLIYMRSDLPMEEIVMRTYDKYFNMNFMLKRLKPYNPNGRLQTEEEAIDCDGQIEQLLEEWHLPYEKVDASENGAIHIFDEVIQMLAVRDG